LNANGHESDSYTRLPSVCGGMVEAVDRKSLEIYWLTF
jgi:hypothetical protein